MPKCTKSCFVILGLLSKADLSGYDLKQIMSKHAKFYWSESNAQIYPVLKKLEKQELVTSKLDKSSGDRQRRLYSITKLGMEKLLEWLQEPVELTPYREELLLKVGLGQHMETAVLVKQIQSYKAQVEDRLQQHAIVVEHIEWKHKNRGDQSYLFMVYDHVKYILDAKINWCDATLAKLQKSVSTSN